MTRPLRNTPTICGRDGCLNTRPCATHRPKPWAGYRSPRRISSGRWARIRTRILRAADWRCAMCGQPAAEVDHITPLTLGGTDDDANLQALCTPCHRTKTLAEARAGRADQVNIHKQG